MDTTLLRQKNGQISILFQLAPLIKMANLTPCRLLRIPSQHFGLVAGGFENQEFNGNSHWSLYGTFTHIWLKFMVNVGKYTIHGASGSKWDQKFWVNLIWLIQVYFNLEVKNPCSLTILGQRHMTIILGKLGWYPSQEVESEALCWIPEFKHAILEWP